MTETIIHTIDLNFQGRFRTIGVYLIPHALGGMLVEAGPGSALPVLQAGLAEHGLRPSDITDVFLTHIHLDHAGASGWLARQGARIHVHPNGAPHMHNPEKLLASAARIYGDQMNTLWGEFLPVPEDKLNILHDGQIIEVGGLQIRALDVQGHAQHHFVYFIDSDCFSGDIGGIRLPDSPHISLPAPPPEFHIEAWRESISRLRKENITRIIPTHFGIYNDPAWHLQALERALGEVEAWMEATLPLDLPIEELRRRFVEFEKQRMEKSGLDTSTAEAQQLANPAAMSADGIQRYWRKYRTG
ncbi:MAG: MBL fold metallo-hydrolase [Anaerolineales bacterium]|nr:MBL fold metallo-hydrolase [Anaerolineales bacterium]